MKVSSPDIVSKKAKLSKDERHNKSSEETFAVIDIASTAIRLMIADIDRETGTLRLVESLQQSVSIGRDTFTHGFINKANIEESVKALRHFSQVLDEYGITDTKHIRVIATTAVREAQNRESFRDRINIACGWMLEILDLADIARLTYLGFRPFLDKKMFASSSNLLIVEMGGGTTEVCYFDHKNKALSQTFNIGALRLQQSIENYKIPIVQQQAILQQNILRFVDRIAATFTDMQNYTVVALGSEMRFAASTLAPGWNGIIPEPLHLNDLAAYTEKIAAMPVEKIVKKYRIAFSDAEMLAPTLLFYTNLVRKLKKKQLVVASTSMRQGVLLEMAGYSKGEERFRAIILGAAEEMAKQYHADIGHARRITVLAEILFDSLIDEHRLKSSHRLLLSVAAMLHDIGLFVAPRNHHKHTMYLIQNTDLFGLNSRDIKLVALIARYHRKSSPRPTHPEYMALDFADRIIVTKLSALLRVADALDNTHSGRISTITCALSKGSLVLTAPDVDNVSSEEIALENKGTLFEDVYGLRPVIRPGR